MALIHLGNRQGFLPEDIEAYERRTEQHADACPE